MKKFSELPAVSSVTGSEMVPMVQGGVTMRGTPSQIVAGGLGAVSAKAAPVDADGLLLLDSAASNVPKYTLWSNIKTAMKTFIAGGFQLTGALLFKSGLNNTASAATVDLTTLGSNTAHVTGTTGISALTMTSGQVVDVIFDGVLTLTHHVTNNNLPGAANITTAAGDRAKYWYDGTTVWCVVYQKADGTPVVSSSSAVTTPPAVRQTVLSGTVDSFGFPNFGGSTGSTTVTTSTTLKATCAAGGNDNRTGSIVNPSWTGLSTNGTMYLYLDIASDGTVTTGSTTLAPTYQWGGTYSTTNLQNTFNIQEMTMKVGNGSSASQTYRVFVGEVTVAGGVVTAITWYALLGRYVGAFNNTLPAASTQISANHNIGVTPRVTSCTLRNLTSEGGYAVGDEVSNVWSGRPSSTRQQLYKPMATRLSMSLATTDNSPSHSTLPAKAGGNDVTLTAANWAYRLEADRGW